MKVEGKRLNIIKFVDDIGLIAKIIEKARNMSSESEEKVKNVVLEVNLNKSKSMVIKIEEEVE